MQSRARVRQWTARKWSSKNSGVVVTSTLALAGLCLLAASTIAAASDKNDKAPAAQMVDSGSFGVFMNGHRVATETFSIHQSSGGSSIVSEFKSEAGVDK